MTSCGQDWRPVQTYYFEDPPLTGPDICWLDTEKRIVGERAVRILLECFLVLVCFRHFCKLANSRLTTACVILNIISHFLSDHLIYQYIIPVADFLQLGSRCQET